MECFGYVGSKNMWFCACKNKPYIVATIITKHANKGLSVC